MSAPIFPCRRVQFDTPVQDPRAIVGTWLKERTSEKMVLVNGEVLASEEHAWVVHSVTMRNHERASMKSNSIDGEFMRLLAGTHHVSASFKRSGLSEGDTHAWIIDLDNSSDESDFENHATLIGSKIVSERPSLQLFKATRLGIETGEDENAAIGHVHLADMR